MKTSEDARRKEDVSETERTLQNCVWRVEPAQVYSVSPEGHDSHCLFSLRPVLFYYSRDNIRDREPGAVREPDWQYEW